MKSSPSILEIVAHVYKRPHKRRYRFLFPDFYARQDAYFILKNLGFNARRFSGRDSGRPRISIYSRGVA